MLKRANAKWVGRLLPWLAVLGLIALAGCQTLGPASVKAGRAQYNAAIHQTDKESLLLNLVRLRYNETPYFMEVSSVIASPVLEIITDATATITSGAATTYGVTPGLAYIENPSITYVPLSGERLIKRMLTPVDARTLTLLTEGGWDADRILRLCIQSVNGVGNAQEAAGPTPEISPEYEVFRRIAKNWRTLEQKNLLLIGAKDPQDEKSENTSVEFSLMPAALEIPAGQQLLRDLALDPKAKSYRLKKSIFGGGGDTVAVVTRPIMGIMYYLSQGVQVPKADITARVVTVTRDTNGNLFNWGEITAGLMNVQSSVGVPDKAYVAVYYRGHWFYISDDDIDSKRTFSLLSILLALNAGQTSGVGPIITRPIGGGGR